LETEAVSVESKARNVLEADVAMMRNDLQELRNERDNKSNTVKEIIDTNKSIQEAQRGRKLLFDACFVELKTACDEYQQIKSEIPKIQTQRNNEQARAKDSLRTAKAGLAGLETELSRVGFDTRTIAEEYDRLDSEYQQMLEDGELTSEELKISVVEAQKEFDEIEKAKEAVQNESKPNDSIPALEFDKTMSVDIMKQHIAKVLKGPFPMRRGVFRLVKNSHKAYF
jgi:hypothetical protein